MKFSIVTVSFNASRTIRDTITSVVTQDWPDFEHIIIDGASTDATQMVVSALQHDRLRFVSEPDHGCYDAMNKGLRLATGDVVAFLNADDFLARPDALRVVAKAFEQDTDCVVGQTVIVAQNNIRQVRRVYRGRGFHPWMLRFGHMPPHPSFYARRTILNTLRGFDTNFRISADFDQMVKLFLVHKASLVGIPETLTVFREGGLSTANLNARMIINREIRSSLIKNGLTAFRPQLWLRYPFKAIQLMKRSKDYPQL